MSGQKFVCSLILFAAYMTISTGTVWSQPEGYPAKPISLVIPFAAGGGSDILGRVIVSLDYEYFGTNMVPVIKPGASGSIATDFVYHSKPDGYTLLLGAPHMITLLPHMRKVNYDPREMIFVSNINQSNSIAITPRDRPWSTWKEFVEHVRKSPGKYSYGSTGTWGITHVRIAAVLESHGLRMVHVPYGGGAEVNQAVMRGEVDFGISSPSHALSVIRSGDARPLGAVLYRHPALPDVPSFEELGIQVRMPIWRGILAPPKTPKAIVDWLERRFAMLVKDKSFVSTMKKLGEDIVYIPQDEWTEQIREEYVQYGDVIKSMQ